MTALEALRRDIDDAYHSDGAGYARIQRSLAAFEREIAKVRAACKPENTDLLGAADLADEILATLDGVTSKAEAAAERDWERRQSEPQSSGAAFGEHEGSL